MIEPTLSARWTRFSPKILFEYGRCHTLWCLSSEASGWAVYSKSLSLLVLAASTSDSVISHNAPGIHCSSSRIESCRTQKRIRGMPRCYTFPYMILLCCGKRGSGTWEAISSLFWLMTIVLFMLEEVPSLPCVSWWVKILWCKSQ